MKTFLFWLQLFFITKLNMADGDGGGDGGDGGDGNGDKNGGDGGNGDKNGGDGGGDVDHWAKLTETLSDDHKATLDAKGFDTLPKVLDAYKGLTRLMTKDPKIIELPDFDDEKSAGDFYNKLGRPEKTDGYNLQFPKDYKADETLTGGFKEWAHKAGLNQKQLDTILTGYLEWEAGAIQAIQDKQASDGEAALEAVKKQHGSDFEMHTEAGKTIVRALGLDENTLSAFENSIGTAGMLNILGLLGKKLGEDEFIENYRGGEFNGDAKVNAKAEMQKLRGDADFQKSLFDNTHPQHKQNVEKWRRLQKDANS